MHNKDTYKNSINNISSPNQDTELKFPDMDNMRGSYPHSFHMRVTQKQTDEKKEKDVDKGMFS